MASDRKNWVDRKIEKAMNHRLWRWPFLFVAVLAIVASIFGSITTIWTFFDRFRPPVDNRMVAAFWMTNSLSAPIGVGDRISVDVSETSSGLMTDYPTMVARIFPINLPPGENGMEIPPGHSREFQFIVSDNYRDVYARGAGQLRISGVLTNVNNRFEISMPFYNGGMMGTVNIK
jgi:hypothetical protein